MTDATLKMVIILFVFNVLLIVGFSMVGVNYKEKAVKEIEQIIAKEVVRSKNQAEYEAERDSIPEADKMLVDADRAMETIANMKFMIEEHGIELTQIMFVEPLEDEDEYILKAYDYLINYPITGSEEDLISLIDTVSDLIVARSR